MVDLISRVGVTLGRLLLAVALACVLGCEEDFGDAGSGNGSSQYSPPDRAVKASCGLCGGVWYEGEILFMDDYHAKDCPRAKSRDFFGEK